MLIETAADSTTPAPIARVDARNRFRQTRVEPLDGPNSMVIG